jgi:hypothetical protein
VVARLDLVTHPARGTRFLFEWFEVFYNRQRPDSPSWFT